MTQKCCWMLLLQKKKKTEWKTNEKHQNGEKVYIIKLSSVSCAAAVTWQARKGID